MNWRKICTKINTILSKIVEILTGNLLTEVFWNLDRVSEILGPRKQTNYINFRENWIFASPMIVFLSNYENLPTKMTNSSNCQFEIGNNLKLGKNTNDWRIDQKTDNRSQNREQNFFCFSTEKRKWKTRTRSVISFSWQYIITPWVTIKMPLPLVFIYAFRHAKMCLSAWNWNQKLLTSIFNTVSFFYVLLSQFSVKCY